MPILLIGRKAIAQAIGVGYNSIPELAEKHGLPAWQDGGRGVWKALPDEVSDWLKRRRRRCVRSRRRRTATTTGNA
ncbi:hypothetical protein dsx2_3400 [Desulfovibrio sp. X2]|nr:hypothetical protein dsx2_3400 [Desulfovibrio sp. X2]